MNRERLLKLADHLEFGVLGHPIFNFSRLNEGPVVNEENLCKTSGCAIGECPIAFPEDWEFKSTLSLGYEVIPVLKNYNEIDPSVSIAFKSAQRFFDITDRESEILFLPSDYDDEEERDEKTSSWSDPEELNINGKYIARRFNNATAKEIAEHIRYFVELKEL